jgi:FKBP-type peptidyl-prolyl cis-trans isomerase FkpA
MSRFLGGFTPLARASGGCKLSGLLIASQLSPSAMSLRIPRPKFPLWWLVVVVALAALTIFALMPVRPGIVELKVGKGPEVVAGDEVEVHYVGRLGGTRLSDWLGTGKEFDSSRSRNAPATFKIGAGQLIRGWDIGMIGLKAGGVRKLIIPSSEAYGSKGIPPMIPPNATLIFEVEVLKILPKPGK